MVRYFWRLATMAGLAMTAVLGFGSAAQAQGPNETLVVTSTGDDDDADVFDGTCATAGGECTLRAAITQANNNLGPDTIHFAIPGDDVHTINLGAELPPLNDLSGPVTIDGYTQPGATPNTDPLIFNADIRIQIDGDDLDRIVLIQAPGNTLRGLSLYDAHVKIELLGENADGNTIVGNLIGTNVANTFSEGSGDGVLMQLGPDQNVIGTPDLADRNVISGTGQYGIRLNHGETSRNVIQNNIIGLGSDGQTDLGARINGIDIQWWTWGNLVGGTGPHEHNVVSGNRNGIDLSHAATGNSVIGNIVGAHPDGTISNASSQQRGMQIKDGPSNNYVAYNTITNSTDHGIWHKHNYNPRNTFAFNTITDNDDYGIHLAGVDDIYYDNILANNQRSAVNINNFFGNNSQNAPDEDVVTANNSFRLGHLHGNGGATFADIDNDVHLSTETPTLTGIEVGAVYGDDSCSSCIVDIWASGSVNPDGTVSVGSDSEGWTWLGTVTANNAGVFSMAHNDLQPGVTVWAVSLTSDGEISEASNQLTVTNNPQNPGSNPSSPDPVPAAPDANPLPPPYVPVLFECGYDEGTGTLSWTDAGASAYFAFASNGGNESYLGEQTGTSASVAGADSYRVTHWAGGFPTTAFCDGPGEPPPEIFECSYNDGTLSWSDAGASNYFIRSVTNDVDTFTGSTDELSFEVAGADTYRVIHWLGGQNVAECDGPGPAAPIIFECSYEDGTLSWTDAGADAYFIRSVTDGVDTYLGVEPAGSLSRTVDGADTYRVIHWLSGSQTVAECVGPGPAAPIIFECSYEDGTLSWTDAGADTYFVRSVTDGVDTYLGAITVGTSFPVDGADTYRVIHWLGGSQSVAECAGPGPAAPFSCSVSGDALTWDDAEANAYFVFAEYVDANDVYLGEQSGTSLTVPVADSYRVIHWLGGQTIANCLP